ncbi:helix-turn-helix domain-containing protein [Streptomyces murinus]|uniref:helix-turn-helix domain-containing protein n=1 Tax=Streptomyces murinus TaxID=33900 RepID=UPI0038258B38
MSSDYEQALGRRIAAGRKRRGLSQKEFAALLMRSEAWLSQVERGVRRIDRMTVLGKVADVLGVPVAELAAGAPLMATAAEDTSSGAGRLRLLLSAPHALKALVGRERDGAPADVTALRTEVELGACPPRCLWRPDRTAGDTGAPVGIRRPRHHRSGTG